MRNPTHYLFPLALSAVLFFACQQPAKQPAPPKPAKNHLGGYPQGSAVIQSYTQFLRSLDTLDLTTSHTAVNGFDSLFAGQSPEICDTGFMLFWTYQHLLKIFGPNAEKFLSPAAQQKRLDNNFIVMTEEGGSGPFLSAAFQLVSGHFSRYVSGPMKEALAQEVIEEKAPFMGDDDVIIGSAQLVHRTIGWERFLARYPQHIYDSAARTDYNEMLRAMVDFSYDPPRMGDSAVLITPFYDSVFRLIRDSFPDSHTNAVTSSWCRAIFAKDSARMKAIRDSILIH